jgi:prefoldin subunit 5
MSAADEMNTLKAEANYIQNSLDAINKRIDELSKRPAEAL